MPPLPFESNERQGDRNRERGWKGEMEGSLGGGVGTHSGKGKEDGETESMSRIGEMVWQ